MVTSKWYRFRVVENDIIWLSEACQYFNEDAIVLFSCTKILNQETQRYLGKISSTALHLLQHQAIVFIMLN